MFFNIKPRRRVAIIAGMVIAMLLLVSVGVSSTQAQSLDRRFATLNIETQYVDLRYPDGTHRTVRVEGHIEGQPNGRASGTIYMDDGSQVVRYDATTWSSLVLDERGNPAGVNFSVMRTIQRDEWKVTDTLTLTIMRSSAGFNIGDGSYTLSSVFGTAICVWVPVTDQWGNITGWKTYCCSEGVNAQLVCHLSSTTVNW